MVTFCQGPFIYKDLSRQHILFVMALDWLFLVVHFCTAASVVSYMAILARLYMLTDINFRSGQYFTATSASSSLEMPGYYK